jgi:hypothetical protein
MPDDDVVPEDFGWLDDPPPLELPLAGGEPLDAYVRRVIVDDPTRKSLASQADRSLIDVSVRREFCPSVFSISFVEAHYAAFRLLEWPPPPDRLQRLVDHLWTLQGRATIPLILRMAAVPKIDLGDIPDIYKAPPFSIAEKLRVVRQAAARRDFHLARMCTALQEGAWSASCYLPGDIHRHSTPLAAAWWADRSLVCNWEDGHLRPRAYAVEETPTFLGVRLAATSVEAVIAATAVSESDAGVWMRNHVTLKTRLKREGALQRCRVEAGCTYREALAAWNALPDELRGTRGGHK